jgi:hypothetical protein
MGLITERTDLDAILIKQINMDVTLTNILSALTAIKIENTPFRVTTEITRPADTIAYAIGDIVNNGASPTVLPTLDFGIGNANKNIIITGYSFKRNYAINVWPYDLYLYNANVLTGQTLADNTAFNPTFAEQILKLQNTVTWTNQDGEHFNASNSGSITNFNPMAVQATLDANGKLYLAVIVNTVFTPPSASIQDFTLTGIIY